MTDDQYVALIVLDLTIAQQGFEDMTVPVEFTLCTVCAALVPLTKLTDHLSAAHPEGGDGDADRELHH